MTKMEVFKYLLDTLTAAGTCGAVFVALWLSRGTAKKASADAEARAGLVAAHHLNHVRNIAALARKLAVLLPASRASWANQAELRVPIALLERESLQTMGLDVLAQLLPLADHCASRLGRSIGELSTLLESIDSMSSLWCAANAELRSAWIERWADQAQLTALNLEIVLDECAQAASTHAPSITAAELGLENPLTTRRGTDA
ncbi:hypothetical protein SAMN05216567_10151 [Variovorax sp. OK605]|uniref:hypothetical protein n=1 Tax=Variovorax sp. OK605 TaxID=1855317 RepID=UPI0008EAD1FF|nr:hypothetical protein [Variovorax sp. OK605]SFO51830.1 hypothetical protein SAMN05216567_10151 [Variovorax sp. OK605]